MREDYNWYDLDDSHYQIIDTEGYISYSFKYEEGMLEASVPKKDNTGFENFRGHFRLISHQLY